MKASTCFAAETQESPGLQFSSDYFGHQSSHLHRSQLPHSNTRGTGYSQIERMPDSVRASRFAHYNLSATVAICSSQVLVDGNRHKWFYERKSADSSVALPMPVAVR